MSINMTYAGVTKGTKGIVVHDNYLVHAAKVDRPSQVVVQFEKLNNLVSVPAGYLVVRGL